MREIRSLAFIANAQLSGIRGGAEIFHERLVEHFRKYVPHVAYIAAPCSEKSFEDILAGYVHCYDLDLTSFDGVVSSKAPTFAICHPNHVCYLMHTVRVFYDMFDEIKEDSSNFDKQKLIWRMDSEMLCMPHTKRVFTIGQEVTNRLIQFNGIPSTVLHPGMTSDGFYCSNYDYIYMPGRLHKWKRVDLMVRAMKLVKSPVKLKIAGTGDELKALQLLAGDDPRIEFLGYVTDKQMRDLYANALTVIFTPVREDYGYILHEGFKSCKPVITCVDSGEPAQFIKQGENGFAVEPDSRKLAECVDYLYSNKDKAMQMGQNGFRTIENITWDNVVKTLITALEE